MKQIRNKNTGAGPIDVKAPWKLTLRNFSFAPYCYKMTAAQWKELLARATGGDPEAEWDVADRYQEGCKDHRGRIVVRRSVKKSRMWLRRAAEHGNVSAQNTLGVVLGHIGADEKQMDEAFAWLKKAFDAGDTSAAINIAITHRQTGDFRRAVRWFREALNAGDDGAFLELGIHYYWGKGVRRHSKMAVDFFRKASKATYVSESDRDDAFCCLGIAYLEGKGVKQSVATAKQMFLRANVDGDNPVAAAMLKRLGEN